MTNNFNLNCLQLFQLASCNVLLGGVWRSVVEAKLEVVVLSGVIPRMCGMKNYLIKYKSAGLGHSRTQYTGAELPTNENQL